MEPVHQIGGKDNNYLPIFQKQQQFPKNSLSKNYTISIQMPYKIEL